MKRITYILALPLILLIVWSFHNSYPFYQRESFAFSLPDTSLLHPEEVHAKKASVISMIISLNHYSKKKLDDQISAQIFDRYLEDLDDNRTYFLASDIAHFQQYRNELDDYVQKGNLDPIYEMFNLRKQRMLDRFAKNIKALENDYDFKAEEYLDTEREDAPWASSEADLDELWRKEIKNSLLNLVITGKTLEESKELLKTRYERYLKSIEQINSEDVFEIFMNSVANTFDPHTAYFSPVSSQNFNMRINQSFEGIGARLQTDNDYTLVNEIIPGGPAFKSKQLQPNDKIIGVAQGDEGEFVDVIGWRIDDVVSLIRGDKGTIVRLQVVSAGAAATSKPKVIRLVRDKIKLEEQSATKRVINVERDGQNLKLGVITIPSFYIDYEDYRAGNPDYKSTTNDVKKLLAELETEKIDGLIIDLRYNGGGALKEAVDLTGLFIDEGPVVQVRNANGRVNLVADETPGLVYDGPLAVLVNVFSASASEIFAGAIQDYKRGLIIGEQTYGKGTVQSPIDLERYIQDENQPLGQLNLTLSKYYRAAGSSTQHLGVLPDIQMPSLFERKEVGEDAQATALPWDEIRATRFDPEDEVSTSLIGKLQKSYEQRLKSDPDMKKLQDLIKEVKVLEERKQISLNIDKRKQEAEEYEQHQTEREQLFQQNEEKEKNANLGEVNDLYLKNALQVLLEMVIEKMG
ncbi:MAG: carboxy terminal-processing peptidase [Bacteroidia bacterium]|nr:carboxy terminal-processing peptidase [Bacteroidia bacterium]